MDGSLGTGSNFSLSTLSAGTHTIILTVTDSKGATGAASVQITVNPQSIDMNGSWNYYTSNTWAEGDWPSCSAQDTTKGTLTIEQSGSSFALTMDTGITYTGRVSGTNYSGSYSQQINDNTHMTTSISFGVTSSSTASGTATTTITYSGPDATYTCVWGSDINLYR
ncbi:MAG: hypothetical protein KJ737_21015 [Proteobacteria bacterium]|nr:hypothetical protein [Pseudomonadota bacterium]